VSEQHGEAEVVADNADVAGPLAEALAALAETPDEAPDLDRQLAVLARLTVDRVAAADFVSVTALHRGSYTSVAVSSELIRAVDEVQYSEGDGPCIDALQQGSPVAATDSAVLVRWPGFGREALRLGIGATVSVPLFTASGAAVAALNVHSRDRAAVAPLIDGVWAIFDSDRGRPRAWPELSDDGGRQLLAGFAEAVTVRDMIQWALHVLMHRHGDSISQAYRRLIAMSADSGLSVRTVARTFLPGNHG
jgi:hypothetical protein